MLVDLKKDIKTLKGNRSVHDKKICHAGAGGQPFLVGTEVN